MTTDDQVSDIMRATHRVQFGHFGWDCSCGAGRFAALTPIGRARAAAMRHQRSETRKAYREVEGPTRASDEGSSPMAKETVHLRITIEIDVDEEADTGLSIKEWNAMTDEARGAAAQELWGALVTYDSGGMSVLTAGAAGI